MNVSSSRHLDFTIFYPSTRHHAACFSGRGVDKVLTMRMDVFVVGQDDGFVVAPCGAPLPDDEMAVLGNLRFGWTLDSESAAPRLDWQGIAKDIDARGYSIVPQGDVGGLLGAPQQELSAFYPEYHLRFAA
ncbi:MAG TPA: hypothetical protein VIT90_01970 [Lysobacter sp.]